MHVVKYQVANDMTMEINDPEVEPDHFISSNFECHDATKEIIKESILANTDVRIETNEEEYKYEPKGVPLEVGMIQFLFDNGEDIQDKIVTRN